MTDLKVKRKFWIQSANFKSKNFEPVDFNTAKMVLLSHNWALELLYYEEMSMREEENCLPGIGFEVDELEHILHICPLDEEEALCFYMRDSQRKTDSSLEWVADKASIKMQIRLLELFFAEKYDELIQLCDGKVERQG